MNATPNLTVAAHRLRAAWSLFLGLVLLSLAIAPAIPARAQQPQIDPAKRVHFGVNEFTVHNDRDSGQGEIRITLRVWEVNAGCPIDAYDDDCVTELFRTRNIDFRADDGDVHLFNVQYPSPEGVEPYQAEGVTARYGFPLYPGKSYGWEFRGVEVDPAFDDNLGRIRGVMLAENNWGIGEYLDRSDSGHFSAKYHIFETTHLPNLKPVSLEAEGTSSVCVSFRNVAPHPAGPFRVAISANNVAMANGTFDLPGLQGQTTEKRCATGLGLIDPQIRWHVIVDTEHTVIESTEYDNLLERGTLNVSTGGATEPTSQSPTAGQGPTTDEASRPKNTPSPMPSPTPSLPSGAGATDLMVSGVKVNGQVPDGKDDCKDGKNAVSVMVKNGGKAKAEGFTVRLVVDGEEGDAQELSVKSLDGGQEREVKLGEVRLKKGQHTLVATIDADKADADGANNTQTATVSCRAND